MFSLTGLGLGSSTIGTMMATASSSADAADQSMPCPRAQARGRIEPRIDVVLGLWRTGGRLAAGAGCALLRTPERKTHPDSRRSLHGSGRRARADRAHHLGNRKEGTEGQNSIIGPRPLQCAIEGRREVRVLQDRAFAAARTSAYQRGDCRSVAASLPRRRSNVPMIDSIAEPAMTPSMSLSASSEHRVRGWIEAQDKVFGQHGGRVRVVRDVEDHDGTPGNTWKRPGSSTVRRPCRTACCDTGSRSASASSAARTPDAFSSWLAPRRADTAGRTGAHGDLRTPTAGGRPGS